MPGDERDPGTLSTSAPAEDAGRRAEPRAAELPIVDPDAYAVEGEHARGGLGRIVRARDLRLGRHVAIKELARPGAAARRRFEREARMPARLQHPAIVPVYEAGRWPGGEPFYAMKLVEGKTLREVIDAAADLDGRLALLPNVLAVAEAVAFAHSHGIVHRDLKPSNVLVGPFGETVVIDWGLALDRSVPDDDDDRGAVMGTPAYMAPEQAAGAPVDERTDVYALGAMLYHLLAGVPPHAGAGDPLAAARAAAPLALPARQPGVPRDLAAVVSKAMSRAPADRYAAAGALAGDLRRFLTGQLVGAHAYSRWSLLARWARRHRLPLGLGVLFAATLAAIGIAAVRGIVRERNRADARRDELVLMQARGALDRNPTATLAWLKVYLESGADRDQVAPLAAEAHQRGVARHVLTAHRGLASRATYSPDGRRLATAGVDGVVHLWDAAAGTHLLRLSHDGPVRALAFAPGGAGLASAGDDRVVRLWDAGTGAARALAGHLGPVVDLAYSPDGRRLASSGYDGVIWLWDVATGRGAALRGHDGLVPDVAFSPDGNWLASAGGDDTVRVWDVAGGVGRILGRPAGGALLLSFAPDGELVASGGLDGKVALWPLAGGDGVTLSGHRERIEGIAFLPDGVATVSRDGDLRLWDRRGAEVATVAAATELHTLAVSPDGQLIAHAGQDGRVRVRDRDTGTVRVLAGHGGTVYRVAFSPDGRSLVSAGGDVRVWDLAGPAPIPSRVLAGHSDDVCAAVFSPRGDTIATASRDLTVRLWDVHGDAVRELRGHEQMVYRVAFAPAGQWLASASFDRTVRLWDPTSGTSRTLRGPDEALWDLAVSPDGERLAAAGPGADVWIWRVATGEGTPLRGHGSEVRTIAFSPDGARLASGSRDRTVRLWDLATGAARILVGHDDQVERVAFAPSGRTLASAGWDGTVRLWDLASGQARVWPAGQGPLRHVTFSPDGESVASAGADGTIAIWHLATGDRRTLRGHGKAIAHIAFSGDGRRLASASLDGTARVWDLEAAQGHVLAGHRGAVLRVAFSPDGRRLVSAGTDRTARVFTLPRQPLVPVGLAELRPWLDEVTSARIGAQDVVSSP